MSNLFYFRRLEQHHDKENTYARISKVQQTFKLHIAKGEEIWTIEVHACCYTSSCSDALTIIKFTHDVGKKS